jgi:phosphoglycerate dehydrogenase-like enzyme
MAGFADASTADHSKTRLGVVGLFGDPYATELTRRFPVVRVVDPNACDALVVWDLDVPAVVRAIERQPELAWVHMRWAGVPAAVLGALDGRPAVLTNGSGAHGLAVAEYVAGVILAHYKGLPEMYTAQQRSEWLPGFQLRELRGSTVGILGLGDLGLSIARALRGFGVRLRGLRRSAAACPEVDQLFQPGALGAFLDGLDVLVVAAPLTRDTEGLIGTLELARLAKGALLVNVGRALVVDQDAMLAALRSGQLGGVALDVFETEPLPRESPLWQTSNVFISPHCCDATPQSLERGLALFLDNVGRFLSGEPLRNVVDRAAGY